MSCADGNIKTGSRTAKCNFCNYTKNFTVPAVHNFNEWTIKEKANCKNGINSVIKNAEDAEIVEMIEE